MKSILYSNPQNLSTIEKLSSTLDVRSAMNRFGLRRSFCCFNVEIHKGKNFALLLAIEIRYCLCFVFFSEPNELLFSDSVCCSSQ